MGEIFRVWSKNVIFEVVESENIEDIEHLKNILNFYKSKGFMVALDDVGSGYSSLNMIVQLLPDIFRPFYGDYWILDLDKDYKYAIIGTPSKEYLWILSRDKTISDEVLNKLLEKITNMGFDKSKLIYTIQE